MVELAERTACRALWRDLERSHGIPPTCHAPRLQSACWRTLTFLAHHTTTAMEAIAEQVGGGEDRPHCRLANGRGGQFCNFYYQTFDADRSNLAALYVSRGMKGRMLGSKGPDGDVARLLLSDRGQRLC